MTSFAENQQSLNNRFSQEMSSPSFQANKQRLSGNLKLQGKPSDKQYLSRIEGIVDQAHQMKNVQLNVQNPTQEIVQLANQESIKSACLKELHRLHRQAKIHKFSENELGQHQTNWQVVKFAEEKVPYGINYFMKVKINNNCNVHIRVHCHPVRAQDKENMGSMNTMKNMKFRFHSLQKTFKHNTETYCWSDSDPLVYFEA